MDRSAHRDDLVGIDIRLRNLLKIGFDGFAHDRKSSGGRRPG